MIHGAVVVIWVVLFARAFGAGGLGTWAIGIAYVSYDTLLQFFTLWQCRGLHRHRRPPPPSSPPMRLGVVVAARNEAAVLPLALAAIAAQAEPPDLVVVADDGSDDGTASWLRSRFGLATPALGGLSEPSATDPSLRWLRLPPSGKPAALNTALLRVRTEVVLTVDADTQLEPGAIAAIRAAFAADRRLVAATGVLEPACGPSAAGRVFEWFQTYEYIRNFLSRYAWMQADGLLLISGAFAAFRTEALRQVGGFDPDCLVEDYELIHRLRRFGAQGDLGWHTAVIGGARAVTDAPASVPAFLRQRRRWFGGFLQTQFWYRDMVGDRRYGRLGLWMLPVKAADTMQPIYGLTAFVLLVAAAARGQLALVLGIGAVMGAKLAIDLAFHLWSIRIYRRWTGTTGASAVGPGVVAALIEPFSFQLIRHLGAALGWVSALSGHQSWGASRRVGIVQRSARPPDAIP